MTPDELLLDGPVQIRRLVVGPLATNAYLIRDVKADESVVVDPGDEPHRILGALGGSRLTGILLTHCHWDHVQGVDELRVATGAPVAAHGAEAAVWSHECCYLAAHGHWDWASAEPERPAGPVPDIGWDGSVEVDLAERDTWPVGSIELGVHHTPGHSPGSMSFTLPGYVITGDTLFPGGPGLTGWPLSDFDQIITSIRQKLLSLPSETVVLPGHGAATTIGAEAPCLPEWQARGW